MRFTSDDIRAAAVQAEIDPVQMERLLTALPTSSSPAPRFDLVHVLWYAGALIIIGAMTLFATLAFASLGARALAITALVYAIGFTYAGDRLWRRELIVPGGLMIAIAVAMTPMAVYGIQDDLNLWTHGDPGNYQDFYTWIKGSWLPMEIVTVATGSIALFFYRFPFIMFVIAFALWFMSMDITVWIAGTDDFSWHLREVVSMWFGLGMLVIAWALDTQSRNPGFAFWLHLFGLIAFWGGMSLQDSDSEVSKLIYCLINIGLIALSVFLMRRAYAVFGVFGVALYLGHLADSVFKDSLLFPFALSAIGLLIIGLGLWLHKHRQALSTWMAESLPLPLQKLRPVHARRG